MRLFVNYIWMYIFIMNLQNMILLIIALDSTRNFKVEVIDPKSSEKGIQQMENLYQKCSLLCENKAENIVVVQTAIDKRTMTNIHVMGNATAIVYYKCKNKISIESPDENTIYRFDKICNDRKEQCDRFSNGNDFKWKSLNKAFSPKLEVNLNLLTSTKNITIQIEKCDLEERTICNFKINDTVINYRKEGSNYHFEDKYFTAYSLRESPIDLNITKFGSQDRYDVVFNIDQKNTVACSKVNNKFCSHLCKNGPRKFDAICSLNVNKKNINLSQSHIDCSKIHSILSLNHTDLKINGTICNSTEPSRPCKYDCLDMPDCQYMCVKKIKDKKYEEFGYNEKFFNLFQSLPIASGKWSKDTINKDLVMVDECSSASLCHGSLNCIDEDYGYLCANGDYTDKCNAERKNRFWVCQKINQIISKTSNNSTKELQAFKDRIDGIINSNDSLWKKVFRIQYGLKHYFNSKSKSILSKKKKKQSIYAVKAINRLIELMISESRTKLQPLFRTDQNNQTEIYQTSVNETTKELNIPLSVNKSTSKNFVKLIFNDVGTSDTKKPLQAIFFRHTNVDFNDDLDTIDSIQNSNDLRVTTADRMKNSDMFDLRITEKRNVTVRYRLNTLKKFESYSWLQKYEEVCGYLDETSDDWHWSDSGCRKVNSNGSGYCECNHLSNFAMMFSVVTINENHLEAFRILSMISGAINLIFLLLFLIFLIFINPRDKLRVDLLNIAGCLFLGTILFFLGSVTHRHENLCALTALISEFLFLAAFIWKLIFGIYVLRMVTSRTFQTENWINKHWLITSLIAYSVPLLIVIISGSLFFNKYHSISDNVCWIESFSVPFFIFLSIVGLIVAINTVALLFIATNFVRGFLKTRATKVSESNFSYVFFQLVVTMGLTWIPSYFATQYLVAMYLFVIFFGMQGFLMFSILVVMDRDNRERVSSYMAKQYTSLLSKSTLSSDMRNSSKYKSNSQSKSSEQNQSLLSETDKEKDGRNSSIPMTNLGNEEDTKTFMRHPVC